MNQAEIIKRNERALMPKRPLICSASYKEAQEYATRQCWDAMASNRGWAYIPDRHRLVAIDVQTGELHVTKNAQEYLAQKHGAQSLVYQQIRGAVEEAVMRGIAVVYEL